MNPELATMHEHEVTARMVMAEISGQEAATGSKNAGSINNSFSVEKHGLHVH